MAFFPGRAIKTQRFPANIFAMATLPGISLLVMFPLDFGGKPGQKATSLGVTQPFPSASPLHIWIDLYKDHHIKKSSLSFIN